MVSDGRPAGRASANTPKRLPSREATRRVRAQWGIANLSASEAEKLRPLMQELARQIIDEIVSEVAAYAGGRQSREGRIIAKVAKAAIGHFVEVVAAEPTEPSDVSRLFDEMGRAEALAGRNPDAIRAAIDVATHRAANALVELNPGLRRQSCIHLRSALLHYMGALLEDVSNGHMRGQKERRTDRRWLNKRLYQLVVTNAPMDQVQAAARAARWEIRQSVVGCAVDLLQGAGVQLPPAAIAQVSGKRARVLVSEPDALATARALVPLQRSSPVVMSAPVPIEGASAALGWTDRALRLVEVGVIPRKSIVRCAEHHTELLLHADPVLARQEAQRVLAPLDKVPFKYRKALSSTLLAWLQTGEDAQTLGERLGIHEHTVRNHKHKLTEIYGERLKDPEFAILVVLALSAERASPRCGGLATVG